MALEKFAVVKTGGKQYKVAVGQKIKVEKLKAEVSEMVDLDKVLLIKDNQEVKIGTPYLEKATVKAKVLKQGRDKKKIVFKYHSKTRYRKKKGHRQPYCEIEILAIQ